jgi:anti-anti-sigma factor
MQYSFKTENDILIVVINEKRATVDFSAELKEDLIQKIEESNKNVVIDLSATEFVDSSFLGTLVAGLKKATMKSGDLKIVGLQQPVRAMFELTRLYRIFDIFENVDDALNSF